MPDDRVWTVGETLSWSIGYLERNGDDNPRVNAQLLLAAACGVERIDLYADPSRPLSLDERARLRTWLKRRVASEPLQLITGFAPFRYLDIIVKPDVLIPRPETEVLVSEAISALKAFRSADDDHPYTIIDMCTGSGCIACSFAYELENCSVCAVDISPACIDAAVENVDANGLTDRVEVICSDRCASLDDSRNASFDLFVSNPPYVPTDVLASLPEEVTGYDPALALDGGPDGLSFYRGILENAERLLVAHGVLAVELHETCLDQAAQLAEDAGFSNVSIKRDLTGSPRILIAQKG